MLNFDYANPTRIVFGEGSIARLDELVPADARVLVLYGGGSAERNGTLAEVTAALGARTVHRFGGIEPNPTYETLMNAVGVAVRFEQRGVIPPGQSRQRQFPSGQEFIQEPDPAGVFPGRLRADPVRYLVCRGHFEQSGHP